MDASSINRPLITLVDTFSIESILTGRLSLAHLMEFSSFVDLYVLEDSVHLEQTSLDIELPAFREDPDSPLRPLPRDALASAVGKVSENTLLIYNAAPIERTFSLASYDYWLKLDTHSRKQALDNLPERLDYFGASGLIHASHDMEINVGHVLRLISGTAYTVLPSARNLIPFLEAFHHIETPALRLYAGLSKSHRDHLADLLALVRPRPIYLPPLLSVLLSRCASREDIPRRLAELRQEHGSFRSDISSWLRELDACNSLKEKVQVTDELVKAAASMSRLYENKRPTFYREVAGAALDAALDGDPIKMLTKPAFAVVKKGMEQVIPDMFSTRRFTGFMDLYEDTLRVEDYFSSLTRLFGSQLDISQGEVTQARAFQNLLKSRYSIGTPLPG